MADQSRRARRMERHHKLRKASPLNLVSLMDIFTILVFFLLVNSSNTQQLPSNKDLKLPQSVAKKVPEETIVIAVTATDILVQGRKVAEVQTALSNNTEFISALQEELIFLSGGSIDLSQPGRAITVMGHQEIPYELIRKILATCQQANYTKVAFAATQVARK